MILVGNIIGCLIIALIAKESGTINEETISGIISSRERNDAFQTLFRSIGCGFLMELAVWSWRSKGSVFGVLLCVPAFILSGFYHSVADAFYYLVSYDKLGIWVLWIYPITVIGNFIGCSIRRVFYGNSEESNK
jgi:formate/nitrite transporter FocA (FNT family)